jgi:UPF0271 protein
MKIKVYILDASSLIGGVNPSDLKEFSYISPLVREEINRNPLIRLRILCAIEERKLKVKTPTLDSLKTVRETARQLGETTLSEADIETIALAIDLKKTNMKSLLISDDYSIENICESLEITYTSLITRGIGKLFKWIYYCSGCGKDSRTFGICPVCGLALKRKPKPTRIIKHRQS